MSDPDDTELAQSLRKALGAERIPPRLYADAQKLLERLERPMRLTLFGLPGAGKSRVLNLLLGKEIVEEGDRMPTLELTYGDKPHSTCVLGDGRNYDLPYFDGTEIARMGSVFVSAEMPLPALKKISVMEIVTTDPASLQRAVIWALDKTDIALWCTQDYGPHERSIWEAVPDKLKDNAMMLVTKADILAAQGQFEARIPALQNAAAEHFNRILPIATLQALNARRTDGSVDRSRLSRSGGQALISAVMNEIKLDRQSVRDQIELLLQKYAPPMPEPAAPQAAPAPQPAPAPTMAPETVHPSGVVTPMTRPAPAQTAAEPARVVPSAPPATERPRVTPAAAEAPRPTPTIAPVPEAPTTPARPIRPVVTEPAAAEDTPQKGLSQETRKAYEKALEHLSAQGLRFTKVLEDTGELDSNQVIRESLKSVQKLGDYLEETGADDDNGLSQMRDAAFEAADLLQLIQMEQDENALLDASSILLQLKRDMQSLLAA